MLLISCVATAETLNWKDLQGNIDSWINGPVSLVFTDQERDVYSKLKVPEEKMQFIKIFWARRDPVLRTRSNEFKEEFYKRLDYADKNFGERKTPGWQTARGQVYIVFGPPSRIDHESVPDSSRPALLWVYDKLPAKRIPSNEALMFVWHEFKYVLAPPGPETGDSFAAQQAAIDRTFRYESIPGLVEQAFVEVAQAKVIDEKKDYDELLTSVRTTEKFGVSSIDFNIQLKESQPRQVQVSIPSDGAPVYDDGDRVFAEFVFVQELRQGETVIARNEQTQSFSWTSAAFEDLKEIVVKLPALDAPSGQYLLWVTVQDRISNVSETRKTAVSY